MNFKIKPEEIYNLKNFMMAIQYSHHLIVNVSESGVTFYMDDASVKGAYTIPVVSDGFGSFPIKVSVLNKLISVANGEIQIKVDDENMCVKIDNTELNFSLPYLEESEKSVSWFSPSESNIDIDIKQSSLKSIIEDLAISKFNRSFMIKILELSGNIKYGSSTHTVSRKTPEFDNVKCNVGHEFLKPMTILSKISDEDIIRFRFSNHAVCITAVNSGISYWTETTGSMGFEEIDEILEQSDEIILDIFNFFKVEDIIGTIDKLLIPLDGMNEHLAEIIADPSTSSLSIIVSDLGNKMSRDSIRGVSILTQNLVSFRTDLKILRFVLNKFKNKKALLKIKDSVITCESDTSTDIVFKYI